MINTNQQFMGTPTGYPNNQYMGYHQSIQPNTIGSMGNMVGIGNNGYNNYYNNNPGYNGGYYSNTYNNYYNPYVAARQQEMQMAQQMEIQRQQTDMMKRLSRNANKTLGKEISEEELNRIYDPQSSQQYMNEQMKFSQEAYEAMQTQKLMMHVINQRENNLPKRVNQQQAIHNQVSSKYKEQFPDDMGIFEYFEDAWKIARDAKEEEYRKQQRNLSQLYDRNKYNELLKMHSNTSNYFNSALTNPMRNQAFGNVNIDDMEVKLPESLKRNNIRKQQFLDSIFNNK